MYKVFFGLLLVLIVSGCSQNISQDDGSPDMQALSGDDVSIDAAEQVGEIEQESVMSLEDDFFSDEPDVVDASKEQYFLSDGLQADTSKKIIDFADILDGGPGKDGIPSIDYPIFVSQDDPSNNYLSTDSQGILLIIDDVKRWYPYNILNWHEIVNDTFLVNGEEIHVAVTFCPLCGSAIVFDRVVDGVILSFGVSGKLYNSNLLMYDRTTESLWSQTLGQAVVGDYVGTKLSIIDSNVISWSELETHHLDAMVLSTDTGRPRNYSSSSPYGSYDTNERLYFPVANMEDARLPLKEMLYVTNIADGVSIAFVLAELRNQLSGRLLVDDDEYIAYYEDAEYRIIGPDGDELPGFFEMWFSWANKHPGSSYIGIE